MKLHSVKIKLGPRCGTDGLGQYKTNGMLEFIHEQRGFIDVSWFIDEL